MRLNQSTYLSSSVSGVSLFGVEGCGEALVGKRGEALLYRVCHYLAWEAVLVFLHQVGRSLLEVGRMWLHAYFEARVADHSPFGG